jgi:hypothetical protein
VSVLSRFAPGCLFWQVSVLEPVILLLRRMPRYGRPKEESSAAQDFDDLPVYLDHR